MDKVKRTRLIDAANDSQVMLTLCQFFDDLKGTENKYELILDEPIGKCKDNTTLCLMAAIAHRFANENNLNVPSWVNLPTYFSPIPKYAHRTTNPNYQQLLRETSFPEYTIRNLFYGDRALNRC